MSLRVSSIVGHLWNLQEMSRVETGHLGLRRLLFDLRCVLNRAFQLRVHLAAWTLGGGHEADKVRLILHFLVPPVKIGYLGAERVVTLRLDANLGDGTVLGELLSLCATAIHRKIMLGLMRARLRFFFDQRLDRVDASAFHF